MESNNGGVTLHYVTWRQVYDRIREIQQFHPNVKFWGVPRGGQIVAGLTGQAVDTVEECDVIVDDIAETGDTYRWYKARYDKPFIVAFNKTDFPEGCWVVFPWEQGEDLEREFERMQTRFLELAKAKPDYLFSDFIQAIQKIKSLIS